MKIKLYAAVAALVLLPAPAAAAKAAAAGPARATATPARAAAAVPAKAATAALTKATGSTRAEALAKGAEWPQPGFGPGNTHYNNAEKRLNAKTIAGVTQRWTLPTRSKSNCATSAAPVLAGGKLFTSDPGGLGAYDPTTGARRWHVDLPSTTVGRLAIHDRKLIVLSSACAISAGFQSNLTAYNLVSGLELWSAGLRKFSYDLRLDRGFAVLDTNQDGLASTVAFRLRDGKLHWLRRGERGDGLVSAGGRVLLRQADGGARAVDIATNKTLWATKANWFAVGADPDGTRFYIDGPGLSAVDAATGRLLWTTTRHSAKVSADRHRLFTNHDRSVVALDARTGRKLYSVHTPQVAGQAVRAGGLVYAASGYRGPLTVADAATGTTRTAKVAATNQDHPPVIAGGWLYVSEGAVLRAYH
ncbi:PQQ-binding-like beta-propeller repeat protein [Actinoplanes solisilvae]|uniref:outer membrane protein assembly factor BamB family protein n=1 Tax=Actinoplanes solisilvae TaxID=2486853 RepID=UPI000FDAE502|nr:PQQ-binding-like beta-propeller repeat protein [Actinoplanes solisilvae]